jgi:DNA-directed RNA polymerase subunit D
MQVKFLKKNGFEYKFLLEDTRNDILNAIRRTILLHVPTFAVTKVSIYKNEGVMLDEMLASRLGLVPIYASEVDDSEHHLYLKKNNGMVYSGDITTTGILEVPLKNIPITVLKENKNLELELTVKKGYGKDHVKFSPANVYFNNLPELKQKGDVDIKICPKNIFEKKANKIFLKDPYSCDLCRYCEDKSNGNIQILLNDEKFVLNIIPFGSLDLKTIITETYNHLNNELNELKASLNLEPKSSKSKQVVESSSKDAVSTQPKKVKEKKTTTKKPKKE